MKGHGSNMTRKQEQAIAALLTLPTVKAAAKEAGVTDQTLRTWLADPEFLAAYRAARRQILEHAVAHVQQATGEAVKTLRQLLKCKHLGTRARAAVAILDQAAKGLEAFDFDERLAELERRAAAAGEPAGPRLAGDYGGQGDYRPKGKAS